MKITENFVFPNIVLAKHVIKDENRSVYRLETYIKVKNNKDNKYYFTCIVKFYGPVTYNVFETVEYYRDFLKLVERESIDIYLDPLKPQQTDYEGRNKYFLIEN